MLDRPKRRNPRLSSFDYTSRGAYFITICTYRRQPHFNDPILRSLLEEQWNRLPQRFVGITLDSFIIMPDHVHFIVWLSPKEGTPSPSLGDIVGTLKCITAVKWSHHLRATGNHQPGKLWQDRYYDHIIRNENDLNIKRQYIQNNPIVTQLKKGENLGDGQGFPVSEEE